VSKKDLKAYMTVYSFCQVCGNECNLSVHHIIFRSHGGSDDWDNLITLCIYHHDSVHLKRIPHIQLQELLEIKNSFNQLNLI